MFFLLFSLCVGAGPACLQVDGNNIHSSLHHRIPSLDTLVDEEKQYGF